MKLIVTILDDRDVDQVMTALTDQHIRVTRISSTGDLLSPGTSTLLIGIDALRVPRAMNLIAELAPLRHSVVAYTHEGTLPVTGYAEVQVGGFLSFVLHIDHFEQV